MNDAEHDDDYLWNRKGPIDLEIAKIERELSTLGWRAQPLLLPVAIRPSVDPSRGRVWPAWIAGLAMAATVLSTIYVARQKPEAPTPVSVPKSRVESIEPAGQPQRSSDLRDPFSSTPIPSAAKAGDLRDPFGSPREQTRTPPTHSDLKDPFSGNPARPVDKPAQEPADASSDLKDPFRASQGPSPQSEPAAIVDPFRGNASPPSKHSGSDLADPFAKPH
jgi:hypothetical protein